MIFAVSGLAMLMLIVGSSTVVNATTSLTCDSLIPSGHSEKPQVATYIVNAANNSTGYKIVGIMMFMQSANLSKDHHLWVFLEISASQTYSFNPTIVSACKLSPQKESRSDRLLWGDPSNHTTGTYNITKDVPFNNNGSETEDQTNCGTCAYPSISARNLIDPTSQNPNADPPNTCLNISSAIYTGTCGTCPDSQHNPCQNRGAVYWGITTVPAVPITNGTTVQLIDSTYFTTFIKSTVSGYEPDIVFAVNTSSTGSYMINGAYQFIQKTFSSNYKEFDWLIVPYNGGSFKVVNDEGMAPWGVAVFAGSGLDIYEYVNASSACDSCGG
jgi:hypothetical protein